MNTLSDTYGSHSDSHSKPHRSPYGIETVNNYLQHELNTSLSIARQAGEIARSYYGKPVAVEEKISDNKVEPVTIVDRKMNELIVSILNKEFPDDGLLSEESEDTTRRLSKDRVWVIDPLDGTSGFIEGNGDFAVQIGLVVEGQAVLGVVYQPIPEICHWAIKGNGTWRSESEGVPMRAFTSAETEQDNLCLAVTRSHRGKSMNRIIEALGYKEIARGSVGVKISLLVDRLCDLYIHPLSRTKQWDTCAPEVILREAGGCITDCYGQPLRYNTPDVTHRNGILASNGSAHNIVLNRLAPLMSELGFKQEMVYC